MIRIRVPSHLFILLLLSLLLALPTLAAPQPQSSGNTFLPVPEAMFIQKSNANPDAGNAIVTLVLSNASMKELNARTGRTDRIVIGSSTSGVVFRNDGVSPDAKGGDLEFAAFVEIESSEVVDRSDADNADETEGRTRNVPVFEGRSRIGSVSNEPFNRGGFDSGQRVPLTRSVAISPDRATPVQTTGRVLSPRKGVQPIVAAAFTPGTNVFQDRVLMIKDPGVVADPTRTFDACTNAGTPMGVWTFGHLMTEMANTPVSGINASTFTETFLSHWLSNQPINSFNVPQRLAMQALINDWRAASGGINLDLSIAPFRLLAINPRVDLRATTGSTGGYAGASTGKFLDAGEARFTFGVVVPASYPSNSDGTFGAPVTIPATGGCKALRFSMIFEYRVPKCECEDVRSWARSWIKLDSMVLGSATYNKHLEGLTRVFTDAGANPTRPNGSAIGQVRSNEVSLKLPVWEIREFQTRTKPFSFLLETTTLDSMDNSFQNSATLRDFILNEVVPTGTPWTPPPIPLFYPFGSGNAFLGANPQSPTAGFFWNAPGLNVAGLTSHNESRHNVALGTCNGCHARETDTIFVHIEPATPGLPATLSGFLTGINVTDPAGGTVPANRDFDDLERREVDINATAKMFCGRFRTAVIAGSTVEPDLASPLVSIGLDEFLIRPIPQPH